MWFLKNAASFYCDEYFSWLLERRASPLWKLTKIPSPVICEQNLISDCFRVQLWTFTNAQKLNYSSLFCSFRKHLCCSGQDKKKKKKSNLSAVLDFRGNKHLQFINYFGFGKQNVQIKYQAKLHELWCRWETLNLNTNHSNVSFTNTEFWPMKHSEVLVAVLKGAVWQFGNCTVNMYRSKLDTEVIYIWQRLNSKCHLIHSIETSYLEKHLNPTV